MKANWIKGLTPSDAANMKDAIGHSTIALGRLEKLCGEFKSELGTTLPGDFNSPQWALKRAYEDGQVYAYNRVIDLLHERS